MKYLNILLIVLPFLFSCSNNTQENDKDKENPKLDTSIRVGAFNVGVGQTATAKDIALSLKSLYLDILSLEECPILIDKNSGVEEFYSIIAKALGMEYSYISDMSSGNHWIEWGKDKTGKYAGKYKVILSKTPILQSKEFALEGTGWTNSSTIRIETKIKNKEFTFYSLHIPGSAGVVKGSVMKDLVDVVLSKDTSKRIIVMGDFNDLPESNAMQYILNSGFKSVWDDVEDAEQYIDKYKYGQIDNMLINKSSGMKAEIAYSVFKTDVSLSDHPLLWSKIEIGE